MVLETVTVAPPPPARLLTQIDYAHSIVQLSVRYGLATCSHVSCLLHGRRFLYTVDREISSSVFNELGALLSECAIN